MPGANGRHAGTLPLMSTTGWLSTRKSVWPGCTTVPAASTFV